MKLRDEMPVNLKDAIWEISNQRYVNKRVFKKDKHKVGAIVFQILCWMESRIKNISIIRNII